MLLLKLLSRLQNSNTSLLFWYLFTVLKFQILNTTQPSYQCDLVSIQPPRGHNTRSSPYVTLIKPSVHHHSKSLIDPSDMLHLIFGSSFLYHAEFLIRITHPPFSDLHWTCRFNLLHTDNTFHHFFTVSLWAQNLPFQKILSSTLVCFCLSDWSHGSRLLTGLICSSVLSFSSIFSVLVIPKCGRVSWQLVNF